MPIVTFVLPDGRQRKVEAREGQSVMETAVANGVEGIVAECGGSMACATCHVFVDDETFARLGPPQGDEDGMLDFAAADRAATSRLSCQIAVSDALDGAAFTVPATQV